MVNLTTESFDIIEIPAKGENIRQILGTMNQVWVAESGPDKSVAVIEKNSASQILRSIITIPIGLVSFVIQIRIQ
ncbi:MAG: hypothetical protein M3162_02255 [Thermoproteota archaeon]|nr:hypothetical protein [Thermoproteota archaeon]